MASFFLKSTTVQIELPLPEFGNSETYSINQVVNHTYGGQAYVYEQGYPIWLWKLTFVGLSNEVKEALLSFFRFNVEAALNTFSIGFQSTQTGLKDWPATRWYDGCRFNQTALEFVEGTEGYYDVSLTIERISTSTGDIVTLNSGYDVT